MPIVANDIDFHLSGGASNSDPDASLGGVISSTELTDATLHNLFDLVSSAESAAGDTEYRCVYIKNSHGTLTLQNATVEIQADTPSSDTDVEIAVGSAAINGTEQTVADESTPPTGVTFESGSTALALGDIPAGEHKAVWVKRVVTAGASAHNNDNVILEVNGDTGA